MILTIKNRIHGLKDTIFILSAVKTGENLYTGISKSQLFVVKYLKYVPLNVCCAAEKPW